MHLPRQHYRSGPDVGQIRQHLANRSGPDLAPTSGPDLASSGSRPARYGRHRICTHGPELAQIRQRLARPGPDPAHIFFARPAHIWHHVAQIWPRSGNIWQDMARSCRVWARSGPDVATYGNIAHFKRQNYAYVARYGPDAGQICKNMSDFQYFFFTNIPHMTHIWPRSGPDLAKIL